MNLRGSNGLSKILSVSGESTEKYITPVEESKNISPRQVMRGYTFSRPKKDIAPYSNKEKHLSQSQPNLRGISQASRTTINNNNYIITINKNYQPKKDSDEEDQVELKSEDKSRNSKYVLSENNLNEHQMQYSPGKNRNKALNKTGDMRNSLNLIKNF